VQEWKSATISAEASNISIERKKGEISGFIVSMA
jgi:hypothetical protein